jgi:polysaccharide biosynthesis/export protein
MSIKLILVMYLTLTLPGVAQQKGVPQSTGCSVAGSSELLIGSGDLLEVSVYGAPEYRYEVRVSSLGEITLPLAGTVRVAGLATADAERTIAHRFHETGAFNQPQVSLFDKEYATQGASVMGEVQKPGIYPVMGCRNLLDLISAAGGTTPKAGNTVTITHRDRPNDPETVSLAYGPGPTPVTNIAIRPGDIVVVSKAGVVYVVGDVREPAGIIMDNSKLTVLQAIAMARGTTPTAALGSAKLIRKGSNGPQEIPIPLNKILSSQRPDISLQPDDIIFVPTSAAKSATRRGLEAIIQAATGVAIYRR